MNKIAFQHPAEAHSIDVSAAYHFVPVFTFTFVVRRTAGQAYNILQYFVDIVYCSPGVGMLFDYVSVFGSYTVQLRLSVFIVPEGRHLIHCPCDVPRGSSSPAQYLTR